MPHRPSFRTVDSAQPYRLRGTNQQTDNYLFWTAPSFRDHNGTAQKIRGSVVAGVDLQNRSGAILAMGVAGRIPNLYWIAGQWDDSETGVEFVADTTDAQDTDAGDFALETTTNNDGFVVASQVPFNVISLNVTTASVVGASLAHDIAYSNAAGTGWTSMTNLFVNDFGTALLPTGEALIAFPTPLDWGKITAATSGIPTGYYAIRVRATDAPGTAALAGTVELWRAYLMTEGIDDGSVLSWTASSEDAVLFWPHSDAVQPLFETANVGNRATLIIRGT